MNETFSIDAQARAWGNEVLMLWREYEAAGYTIDQMRNNAMFEFDREDLRKYAETDIMPIRIRGKLYPVSEQSASCVATSAIYMEKWRSESPYTAGLQPRRLCIELLASILARLEARQTVTISTLSASQGIMSIKSVGADNEVADVVASIIALAALGLNQFGYKELVSQTVELRPV